MDIQPWQPGWLLADRYVVGDRLGRGGLGVVYRAHDQWLDRPVAIKVLYEHVAAEPVARERLQREAHAAASISHRNVVQVYDIDVAAERPYLVMELAEGGTLSQHVAGRLPLPVFTLVEFGRQIAAGLAAAHATGMVHRDVTLRNVLVAADGALKVADFGLIVVSGQDRLTRTGLAMGTPATMAPEQAQGLAVSPATDIYALGAVLYELATGRPPFVGDDLAVILQHLQNEALPPSALNPSLPAWLDGVIMTMLAKAPADRYPDAMAAEAALLYGAQVTVAAPVIATAVPMGATQQLRQLPRQAGAVLGTATLARTATQRPPPLGAGRGVGGSPPVGRRVLMAGTAVVLLVSLLMLGRAAAGSWPAAQAPVGLSPTLTSVQITRTAFVGAPTTPAAGNPTVSALPATLPPTPLPAKPTAAATALPPTPAPPATALPTAVPPTPIPPTPVPPKPAATAAPTTRPAPPTAVPSGGPRQPVALTAAEVAGGYRNAGESQYADRTGEQRSAVWIYGRDSEYPTMSASFQLTNAQVGSARLTLVGMDSEDAGRMPIAVLVNDRVVFQGPNRLADWRWSEDTIAVPNGVLRPGANTLTIRSLAPVANFNSPPFFMLHAARIAWPSGDDDDDDD